jgi:hypothetical protein
VSSGFNDDEWIMVTDASGTELPLTKEGEKWRQPSRVSGPVVVGALFPGGEQGETIIDVSKHYQLDRPGNYFVRIARRIGVPPDVPFPKTAEGAAKTPLEEAVSDLVPFTITP